MKGSRRLINLILALALFLSGAAALAFLLLFADTFRVWMAVAAAFACSLGGFWLYEDFIDATPNS